MSEPHTHGDPLQKARNGMSPKQEVKQEIKEEDRAAWEGMADMPSQETHKSAARRVLTRVRGLAEWGVGAVRRVLKSRN